MRYFNLFLFGGALLIVSCATTHSEPEARTTSKPYGPIGCNEQVHPDLSIENYEGILKTSLELVPISKQADALAYLGDANVVQLETVTPFGLFAKDTGLTEGNEALNAYLFKTCLVGRFNTQNPRRFRDHVFGSQIDLFYFPELNALRFVRHTMGHGSTEHQDIAFIIWYDKLIETILYSANAAL